MRNRSRSKPVIPLIRHRMPRDPEGMVETPQGEEVARAEGEETGTEVGAMAMSKRPTLTLRIRGEKSTNTRVNPPAGIVERKATCPSTVRSP